MSQRPLVGLYGSCDGYVGIHNVVSVRGYLLYPTLGALSLWLLHIYSICCTHAAYPILHSSSLHCPSS